MSERIEVPAHEAGVIRLFALDLDPAEAARWRDAPEGDDPLASTLGADPFDRTYAEVIRLSDLGAMPLSTYLAEGYGIPEDQLAHLRGRLDAMTGHVAVIMSRAFGGAAQTLAVRAPLRFVARLTEAAADTPHVALTTGAARGTLSPAPIPPGPEGSGRLRRWLLGTIVLVVLGFLLAAALVGGSG